MLWYKTGVPQVVLCENIPMDDRFTTRWAIPTTDPQPQWPLMTHPKQDVFLTHAVGVAQILQMLSLNQATYTH